MMTTNSTISRLMTLALATAGLMVAPGCDSTSTDDESDAGAAVLVANQGNFADGNGSVTRLDLDTGELSTIVSMPGSIIQSFVTRNGLIYVAMNTGDRIDVYDLSRGLVGQIVDVPSPRYLAWTSDDRLLVSNLFDSTVSVVDPVSSVVEATIDVGPNPEGILVHEGIAYVANHGFGSGATVSVIDIPSRTVNRTLQVDCSGPRFTFMDRETDLWVVCTGETLYDDDFNVIGSTDGSVLVLDPATGAEQGRFELEGMILTPGPGQDAFFSDDAEILFVVLGGDTILRFDTETNSRTDALGPLTGPPIGAVAYDAQEQRLYVARVPGFTTAGEVQILEPDGTLSGAFPTGVAPSHIEIVREGESAQ